jgi:hypothetical protein
LEGLKIRLFPVRQPLNGNNTRTFKGTLIFYSCSAIILPESEGMKH